MSAVNSHRTSMDNLDDEGAEDDDTNDNYNNDISDITPTTPSSPATTMTHTSNCHCAVEGAAEILSKNDTMTNTKRSPPNSGGPIQEHQHNMLHLLQPKDTLKMAVKLESIHVGRNRYLAIVSRDVGEGHEECCLLGFDCNDITSIGLVLPIWANTLITLDGDGGFRILSQNLHLIMKPVSVQAMWSALQSLHRASAKARESHYFLGLTHSWVADYEKKISSDRSCLNEWHFMDDIESRRPPTPDPNKSRPTEREETEIIIRAKLKEVMMSVDLDEVTCKFLRVSVEEALNMDLRDFRKFIDEEMLTILGQLDAPTKIYDYLYLGSEWNASNYDELKMNGITHILNVTREIDNFFPGLFDYINIRVYDEEKTDLLKYWDKTFRYILKTKKLGKKCLVHCKMGKSRSASVVIAYVMKTYNWSLQQALDFVKSQRSCIKPNEGFMKQLEIYEGILDASRQRHNNLWRSKSETNLNVEWNSNESCHSSGKGVRRPRMPDTEENVNSKISKESLHLEVPGCMSRPKSWSPDDNITDAMFPKSAPSSPVMERKKLAFGKSSGSLQRVASIRDRIFELESQHSSHSKEIDATANSISRSGLVLNLANQFEAVSKPNTPSPVDEQFGIDQVDKTDIEPPVISQTKPPANRHEAILVRPTVCSGYIDDEVVLSPIVNSNDPPEAQEPLRSTSSTSIDSGVSCQLKTTQVPKTAKSVPFFQGASVLLSPITDDNSKCSVSNSIISEDNNDENDVMRSASSSSVPSVSPFQSKAGNSPIDWQGTLFSYEKEDIPWTPGTVWRTKEQLEENTLKRTKSFDSALRMKSGKKKQSEEMANPVQRSQSLSVHQRGIKYSPTLSAPPVPPIRTTSMRRSQCIMHSVSSPSLSFLSNTNPSQQSLSSTSIPEAKLQHCDSDEGLVMSVSTIPITSPTNRSAQSDALSDEVGVVRRLTQELEAKSKKPSAQKDQKNWELNDPAHSCHHRRNRLKSENIPFSGWDQNSDVMLQRSSSAGSVSHTPSLSTAHNNRYSLTQKKCESSPLRVITSQNMYSESKQIPFSKLPPAASKCCRKMRKHQPDYGKNHPMNKIVSRTRHETAFNAI